MVIVMGFMAIGSWHWNYRPIIWTIFMFRLTLNSNVKCRAPPWCKQIHAIRYMGFLECNMDLLAQETVIYWQHTMICNKLLVQESRLWHDDDQGMETCCLVSWQMQPCNWQKPSTSLTLWGYKSLAYEKCRFFIRYIHVQKEFSLKQSLGARFPNEDPYKILSITVGHFPCHLISVDHLP